MTRIFLSEPIKFGTHNVSLDEEHSRYLKNVLRMRKGDTLILCDKDQVDHVCVVEDLSADEVVVSVISSEKNQAEPGYCVTLFQGVAKGERMDYCIQKSVELGVCDIVPVQCERSVVQLRVKEKSGKMSRWKKIAQEAARQSGRGKTPAIHSPSSFTHAISCAKDEFDLVLFPWENATELYLPDILDEWSQRAVTQECPKIAVFVGPEGGFSEEEADRAKKFGANIVSLGRRILRTETAGPAILAMLLYRLDLM